MLRGVLAIVVLLLGLAVLASPAAAHPQHDHENAVGGAREAPPIHDHENAGSHSHAPGEDTYHQKAAHCWLDVPFASRTTSFARMDAAYARMAAHNETAHGLDLPPPVPPPLA
jgi:hypothetical protein